MVIDHAALEIGPKRIFDFFAELGIRHFGFNAACPPNQPAAAPGTATDHYVSPAAMNRFLAGIYDCWREYGDQSIEIRELTAIRARVGGEPARLCTLQGGCFGHFFVIEPQGEVAHCDLFLGDRRYTLGNILRDDFDYFRNGPKMAALKVSRQLELEGLRYCPDFQVCNGWCPHQHYLAVRHDSDYSNGCCGLRTLISHIRDSLSGGR
jgi:uncharacterized protein